MPRKTTLNIKLPDEFLALCEQDGTTPETVLRGFIADLCRLEDHEGGYSTSGSDERLMARQYYERVGYLIRQGAVTTPLLLHELE